MKITIAFSAGCPPTLAAILSDGLRRPASKYTGTGYNLFWWLLLTTVLVISSLDSAWAAGASPLGGASGQTVPQNGQRDTHAGGLATPAIVAKSAAVSALAAPAAAAAQAPNPFAGHYSGFYNVVTPGFFNNHAYMDFEVDDQGRVVDFFYSGGRAGFSRPASVSGSVDSEGHAEWILSFPADGVTEHWSGTLSNFSAAGTYEDNQPLSATWNAFRGIANLPLALSEPEKLESDPVDTSTGAYLVHHTWLPQNCPAPLAFVMDYNSAALETGHLATGWGHNFEMRLDVGTAGRIVFNWNQQRRNYFKQAGTSSVFTCAERSMRYDQITKNANGTYTLLRADQSQMLFTATGQLTQILNPHGQALNVVYSTDGTVPVTITEAISGRKLTLAYDSSGRLVQVTDLLGRKLVLTYDNNDHLTVMQFADASNQVVAGFAYTYDTVGRILTGSDFEQQTFVTNTYDASGRVITQDDARSDNALTRFVYDDFSTPGQRTTLITNRQGGITTNTFSADFQLLSTTDERGSVTKYTYNANGDRLTQTDPLNRITTFTYDTRGNLLTTKDPSNAVTTMTYDSRNNLIKLQNAAGKATTFTYDAKNNLLTVLNTLGQTGSSTYDANSLLLQRTAPRGGVTTYTYTAGLPASVKDPNNNIVRMAYDVVGRLTSTTDALNKVRNLAYDPNDNLTAVKDPLGNITTFIFDSRHRKLSETDPLGKTTRFEYDGNGNLRVRTDALGNSTIFAYDKEDRLQRTIDPRGGTTELKYDAVGQLIAVTNPVGQTQNFRYDAAGNQIDTVDARGNKTHRTLDNRNLVTAVEDPNARKAAATFDNLRRLRTSTNPLGQAVQLTYDDLDRLVAATDPLNGISRQGYDADGNRVSLTNARNAVTNFAFDLGGRLTSVTIPGPRVTSYTYDVRNLPLTVTEPSGQKTTFAYDDAGRLKQAVDPVGTIDYAYDATGRLLVTKEGTATITRVYDDIGRLTQFTDASGNVLKYGYDAAGNLVTLTYPDGKMVTYGYDAGNRLISVKDWANRVTSYTYDPDGRLTTTTRPNGTVETRTWLPTGEMATLKDTKGATVISQFGYGYDLAGRIVAENPQPPPSPYLPASFTATYDTGNRLTAFNGAATVFDADGNMTSGPNTSGIGSGSYVYDARNRLTGYGGTSYTYDAENRRAAWTDAGGTTRLVTNPNATLTQVLVQTSPTGTVTRSVFGLGLLYEETGSAIRSYHYDFRGSAVAFSDASGTVIGRVEYGPFGEISKRSGDTATSYLFNGRLGVTVDGSGLYFMRARYFHPVLKRFVNQDALLGFAGLGRTLNRFAYALGSPLSLIDPSGRSAEGNDVESASTYGSNEKFNTQVERPTSWTDWLSDGQLFAIAKYGSVFNSYVDPNVTLGYGDAVLFGLPSAIVEWSGGNSVFDTSSQNYTNGKIAGFAASLFELAISLPKAITNSALADSKLALVSVGKNGQFYSLQRKGALSAAQVSHWVAESAEPSTHFIFETGKEILNQAVHAVKGEEKHP